MDLRTRFRGRVPLTSYDYGDNPAAGPSFQMGAQENTPRFGGKIDRLLGNSTSHDNVVPPAVPLASGMGSGKTEAGLIVSQMLDPHLNAVASSERYSTGPDDAHQGWYGWR